jgi:predicted phosphodiesterase
LRNCLPARQRWKDFSLVHGAFRDEDEYVFAPAQALEGLLDAPSPITFFGHTHLQGGFTLRDNKVGVLHFKPVAESLSSTLVIEPGTTYLLNPGSVGNRATVTHALHSRLRI